MKKRILQFTGSFHQGGSERQAVALTRLLHEDATHEIYVATLNKDGVLLADLDGLGLPEISEFKLTSFYNANFVMQVRKCAAYLRENKIDIVHTHDFYTNVFGMAAATLAGVSARIASKRETGGMRSAAQKFVEKLAFSRAKAIIVNSAAVREHLIERSISSDKLHLIYNGLDLRRFEIAHKNPNKTPDEFDLPVGENIKFVTLVANLRHAVKNVPMLLRAAKTVVEKLPNLHFVIAGEGELETEMKAQAQAFGIADKVHFIGRCTDIPALLALSDICVLTSTAEGFSNSILEYMAAGKPVVATNVGGAAEAFVDGEAGYLVPSDDDVTFAARLLELLADEEKVIRFGLKGRKLAAEKFSESTQLASTLRLYENVL